MNITIIAKHLKWDKWNRTHIQKHNLNTRQVEQVFLDTNRITGEAAKERIKIIGKCGKRMITVILAKEAKKYYVITARDSDKNERTLYHNHL